MNTQKYYVYRNIQNSMEVNHIASLYKCSHKITYNREVFPVSVWIFHDDKKTDNFDRGAFVCENDFKFRDDSRDVVECSIEYHLKQLLEIL